MHKILCALVAVFSLLTVPLRPTQAQGNGAPADPPPAPQQMDEATAAQKQPEKPISPAKQSGERIVGPEEHFANLAVSDTTVVLKGHIEKDVVAVNCDLRIEKGATVGGHVVVIGGRVINHAGDAVKIVQQNEELSAELRQSLHLGNRLAGTGSMLGVITTSSEDALNERPITRHDWLGGQFALLLMGLLGALILRIAAPRATEEVAEHLSLQPGRSLLVGGLSAVAMLVVLTINAELLKLNSVFGLIWKPFGFALALAPLIPLTMGWLVGMRYVGNLLARRIGRPEQAGLFSRMLLGLFVFFAVNALCGLLNPGLGVIGLGLECVFAVMGLGAALMTGFGTRPNGMSARWQR